MKGNKGFSRDFKTPIKTRKIKQKQIIQEEEPYPHEMETDVMDRKALRSFELAEKQKRRLEQRKIHQALRNAAKLHRVVRKLKRQTATKTSQQLQAEDSVSTLNEIDETLTATVNQVVHQSSTDWDGMDDLPDSSSAPPPPPTPTTAPVENQSSFRRLTSWLW